MLRTAASPTVAYCPDAAPPDTHAYTSHPVWAQVKIKEIQDELGCLVAWRVKQLGFKINDAVHYDCDHFDRSDAWIGANTR